MDSVYPFAIGVLEFTLVELLGPDYMGAWLICFAAVFGLMVWISHRTMRRARQDESNKAFFKDLEPATLKDFHAGIVMISCMAGAGLYIAISNHMGMFTLIALLCTTGLAIFQFWVAAQFWERSLSDSWPQKPA
jgi:protein-S-isoprenylcysteine O-methyltransferase Ste14